MLVVSCVLYIGCYVLYLTSLLSSRRSVLSVIIIYEDHKLDSTLSTQHRCWIRAGTCEGTRLLSLAVTPGLAWFAAVADGYVVHAS
ncbi:hypothetical protein BD311DRAFT_384931, partial [Dichomitus squalens]